MPRLSFLLKKYGEFGVPTPLKLYYNKKIMNLLVKTYP